MKLATSDYSGTEVQSLTGLVVGTTSEISVAETPSGNTLTMIQVLNEISELRDVTTSHEVVLTNLAKAVDDLRATTTGLAQQYHRLPGRSFVLIVAIIIAAICVGVVAFGPDLREALLGISPGL
jgi:hypothetical protein